MWRIKRIPNFHVIFLYLTSVHMLSLHYNRHTSSYVIAQSTQDTIENDSSTPTLDLDQKSPEEIKHIKREYLNVVEERFFNLKGRPTEPVPDKAFVPRAMLEEYIKMRDSVREFIPDDRDFYGKINIDSSVETHEDFWSAVYNKYGSYDIKVDMGQSNPSDETGYRYKGEASHIAHIPATNPESVPQRFEPILPPHARSVQSQKQFQSVHLTFNLSEPEVYQDSTAIDDLRGAELYISRERLYNCIFHECGKKKPIPFFNNNSERDSHQGDSDSNLEEARLVPRYQRVYILHVYGYDQFGEPRTKIHDSRRIKTDEMTPLTFNVYPIVKTWLMNPKSNYGIIVRVTNDDEDYEKALQHATMTQRLTPQRRARNSTDSSQDPNQLPTNIDQESVLLDHLRLKRDFRFKSENDDEWLKKKPSILIYSKSSDVEKRHVKRHPADNDSMQADDPDPGTTTHMAPSNHPSTSTNPSASRPSESSQKLVTETISRRDQIPTHPRRPSSSRQPAQARSKGKSKQSSRQADRCSKRSLAINFDEVGWSNWIIAPQAYYANYCAGDCSWPLADTHNATNHAIIQAIYHSVGRVVPKSCCAPVKLGKMAILYQLDGIVQMRQYDDMIVEACGCL